MFGREDNTYNEVRAQSLDQWLREMERHEHFPLRCGVRLFRDYLAHLRRENEKLKEENELKNSYLRRAAGKRSK